MTYAGYKGYRSKYPIKLLYVSNLPVIFASALFANVYFFSQLLWSTQGKPAPGTNLLFQILGDYSYNATSGATQAVGGLAYFTSAPSGLQAVGMDPVRAVVYLGILIAFCAIFSLVWLEVGGLGPAKVAQQ